jgi:hypothetical protein
MGNCTTWTLQQRPKTLGWITVHPLLRFGTGTLLLHYKLYFAALSSSIFWIMQLYIPFRLSDGVQRPKGDRGIQGVARSADGLAGTGGMGWLLGVVVHQIWNPRSSIIWQY